MEHREIAPKIHLYRGLCNSYLIDDRLKVLIDAGVDPGKKIDLIILTSPEAKSIEFARELKLKWGAKIACSRGTANFLEGKPVLHHGRTETPSSRRVIGKHIPYVEVDRVLKDGDVIDTGIYKLKVLEAPGHIEGDICLYDERAQILFSNGIWLGNRMMPGPVRHGGKRASHEVWVTHLQELKIKLLCPSVGAVRELS